MDEDPPPGADVAPDEVEGRLDRVAWQRLLVGHLDDRIGQMKLGRPQGNQTEYRSYNPLA